MSYSRGYPTSQPIIAKRSLDLEAWNPDGIKQGINRQSNPVYHVYEKQPLGYSTNREHTSTEIPVYSGGSIPSILNPLTEDKQSIYHVYNRSIQPSAAVDMDEQSSNKDEYNPYEKKHIPNHSSITTYNRQYINSIDLSKDLSGYDNTANDQVYTYKDIDKGDIQYFYGDEDAYRPPNFIHRSNVDHIDFRTPQGAVFPGYKRTTQYRGVVENNFHKSEVSRREEMMEGYMRKRNLYSWQLRARPLSKGIVTGHSYVK